jgi:hypothetical protein
MMGSIVKPPGFNPGCLGNSFNLYTDTTIQFPHGISSPKQVGENDIRHRLESIKIQMKPTLIPNISYES